MRRHRPIPAPSEVARDFAAYWVLYRKYHQDYGVEDILQGKPFDAVVERAVKAGFDERISLVSLLLAGLNTPLCRRAEHWRCDRCLLPAITQF